MTELRFYLGCIPKAIRDSRISIAVKCSWESDIPIMFRLTDSTVDKYLLDMSHAYGLSCYNNIDPVTIVHTQCSSAYVLKLFKYITENTKCTQVKVIDLGKEFEYTLGV